MASLGVHRGDHPVPGDLAGDAQHPILARLEVLAGHDGQQPSRLGHHRGQLPAIQHRQARQRVLGPGVHQRLPRGRVVPVDLRLGRTGVVVPALQRGPQLGLQHHLSHPQQAPHSRADQRDRVHGRHCVVQRGGVQHPPPAHQPCLLGRVQGHLEHPVGPLGTAQPLAHVDQHRVREPAPTPAVVAAHPARIAPAGVEGVALHRLPVRQPLQALQHHHRGHHRRRHTTAPLIREQVGEQLVRKQPVPLPVQQPIHRTLRQHLVAKPGHIIEEVALALGQPQGHRSLPVENYNHVILTHTRPHREHSRPRKTPAT